MAGTMSQSPGPATTPRDGGQLRRSLSTRDFHRRGMIRRSYSDNHLSHRITTVRASMVPPKLKNSRSSNGVFNIQLSSASGIIPETLKSFLFDPETSKEMNMEMDDEDEMEVHEGKKRGNWIKMIVELRNKWKGNKNEGVESMVAVGDGEGCYVEYDEDDDDEEGREDGMDRESFSSLLQHVSWSDTKLFAQMAFLCNMAYVIPDIKTEDLRRHHGLEFVTSSLEKKAAAEAIRDGMEQDSVASSEEERWEQDSTAYEIAASAASYVQSRAKGLVALGPETEPELSDEGMVDENAARLHKSERAACVAASRLTAVVAAGEKHKEKAAKDLQSLHSAPCEWFVCDDSNIYTRCFVIQVIHQCGMTDDDDDR